MPTPKKLPLVLALVLMTLPHVAGLGATHPPGDHASADECARMNYYYWGFYFGLGHPPRCTRIDAGLTTFYLFTPGTQSSAYDLQDGAQLWQESGSQPGLQRTGAGRDFPVASQRDPDPRNPHGPVGFSLSEPGALSSEWDDCAAINRASWWTPYNSLVPRGAAKCWQVRVASNPVMSAYDTFYLYACAPGEGVVFQTVEVGVWRETGAYPGLQLRRNSVYDTEWHRARFDAPVMDWGTCAPWR